MKIILMMMFLLVGCQQEVKRSGKRVVNLEKQVQQIGQEKNIASKTTLFEGIVLETMNASKYTYVKLKTEKADIWLAGPRIKISVGDKVAANQGMVLENFTSKTLNRTFAKIYFVSKWIGRGAKTNATNEHTKVKKKIFVKKIKHHAGEVAIGTIYKSKKQFAGKTIIVRGTVVKFLEQIMGKNWVHIEDASDPQHDDLTITTLDKVKVGSIVSFKGTIHYNKDFGYGYFYPVIMEKGKVLK